MKPHLKRASSIRSILADYLNSVLAKRPMNTGSGWIWTENFKSWRWKANSRSSIPAARTFSL